MSGAHGRAGEGPVAERLGLQDQVGALGRETVVHVHHPGVLGDHDPEPPDGRVEHVEVAHGAEGERQAEERRQAAAAPAESGRPSSPRAADHAAGLARALERAALAVGHEHLAVGGEHVGRVRRIWETWPRRRTCAAARRGRAAARPARGPRTASTRRAGGAFMAAAMIHVVLDREVAEGLVEAAVERVGERHVRACGSPSRRWKLGPVVGGLRRVRAEKRDDREGGAVLLAARRRRGCRSGREEADVLGEDGQRPCRRARVGRPEVAGDVVDARLHEASRGREAARPSGPTSCRGRLVGDRVRDALLVARPRTRARRPPARAPPAPAAGRRPEKAGEPPSQA